MRGKITGFSVVMSLALHASAEPEFPGAIQEAARIPCTPTCLLCHTEIPGNINNVNEHFGRTVLTNGVRPGHPESMNDVVANLRTKNIDTDGDGKIDVDELAAGSDPSSADPNAELCAPTYGCGAQLAPAPPATATARHVLVLGIVAVTALIGARRLRRVV